MLQSPYLITRVTAQRDRTTVIVTDRLYTHLTTFHLPSHLTFLYLSLSSITLHYPIPISLSPFPPHLLFSHPYTFPSYPPSSPSTPLTHFLPSLAAAHSNFLFPHASTLTLSHVQYTHFYVIPHHSLIIPLSRPCTSLVLSCTPTLSTCFTSSHFVKSFLCNVPYLSSLLVPFLHLVVYHHLSTVILSSLFPFRNCKYSITIYWQSSIMSANMVYNSEPKVYITRHNLCTIPSISTTYYPFIYLLYILIYNARESRLFYVNLPL